MARKSAQLGHPPNPPLVSDIRSFSLTCSRLLWQELGRFHQLSPSPDNLVDAVIYAPQQLASHPKRHKSRIQGIFTINLFCSTLTKNPELQTWESPDQHLLPLALFQQSSQLHSLSQMRPQRPHWRLVLIERATIPRPRRRCPR